MIPVTGLTDDAAMIISVVSTLALELSKYAKDSAKTIANIQVQKHNRIVRITLIGSIIAAILTIAITQTYLMENYLNLYKIFQLALFGINLYGCIQIIINLLRYKPYYDKIPEPIQDLRNCHKIRVVRDTIRELRVNKIPALEINKKS